MSDRDLDAAAARAARRRETWDLRPLDEQAGARPEVPSMLQNWRLLEQLRRAAWALRGEPYPGRSTREERRQGPESRIRA